MKFYLSLIVFLYSTLLSFAQVAPKELYSKIYFEADKTQFEKLHTLMTFEHLAKSEEGFVGVFNEEEKNILLNNASNVKVLITDVSSFYKERAQEDLKKNPRPNGNQSKKTRAGGVPANYHGGSMGGFMTLSEMQQNLDSMSLLYPNLISVKQSLGTTIENRPVYMYKISDNHILNEPQEHKTMFTALHHAREPQSAAQLIYFMWYLLENYNTPDSVVKHLVDDRELFFIPVLNPDGYAYNEQTDPNGGGMWRKNRKVNGGGYFGVDLNRNYAKFWGFDNAGSSPNPANDTYRGTAGFSENETQIARDFTNLIKPKVCLNYHAYGDWFIYPWGYANLTCPDDTTFQMIADFLTEENQYISGNCWQTLNYLSNGSSDDWHYGEQVTKPKVYAITPEVGDGNDGFWPAPSNIIPLCQENLLQNIMASWMSGPYIEHKRLGQYVFQNMNISLAFNFKNYGLDTCLQLKSWFVSSNPWIQQNNDTIVLNNMITHQSGNDNLSVTMQNNTPDNTVVNGRLYTKYNNFIYSDTVSYVVKKPSAAGNIELYDGVSVSPNPGRGIFNIKFENMLQQAQCKVFDITGKMISTNNVSDNTLFIIDLSAYSNGIYFAEISDGNLLSRVRLLKY